MVACLKQTTSSNDVINSFVKPIVCCVTCLHPPEAAGGGRDEVNEPGGFVGCVHRFCPGTDGGVGTRGRGSRERRGERRGRDNVREHSIQTIIIIIIIVILILIIIIISSSSSIMPTASWWRSGWQAMMAFR